MDAYLMKTDSGRRLVTESVFKSFDVKKKKVPSAANTGKSKAGSVNVESFGSAMGCSTEQLNSEFTDNLHLMETKGFTRDDRLSDRLGTRLISVSGILWNRESQNRGRDWSTVAAAVTVETALVRHYRKTLIDDCSGALAIRSDIRSLFLTVVRPRRVKVDGLMTSVVEYQFADNLPPHKDGDYSSRKEVLDADCLMRDWDRAHATFVKGSHDSSIVAFIQSFENNALLACSGLNVPAGAIETIAHHHISALVEVTSGLRSFPVNITMTDSFYYRDCLGYVQE